MCVLFITRVLHYSKNNTPAWVHCDQYVLVGYAYNLLIGSIMLFRKQVYRLPSSPKIINARKRTSLKEYCRIRRVEIIGVFNREHI